MIGSKYMGAVTAVMVCLALAVCGFIVYAADAFDTSSTPEYEGRLFGDEVISLDIQADDADWQNLLDNAQAKEWISVDVVIGGERFSDVGIRPKGNSSLSQGAGSGEGRYSLQIKLNKYVKGQTYYGLDTFCVNNMMGDATYMKDYLSYDIMRYIGVDTPLVNYASVKVNGQDYGFFIALERYDKAFLDRVYNTSGGQLYNVKIQMGMRGDFEDMRLDTANNPAQQRQFNAMGMGGSGGGSLLYTDDEISSYASIFDNATFDSSDIEKRRVIAAIQNLNAGTDLEEYFDVDAILRYFAAHTVLVNLDSYSSNMQQNYYIYERDGKLTILPWDYGLAFGGFQSGDASGVVNFPIDTPVSGVSLEERPLLNKLLEAEEYKERYHQYLLQIVEGYFEGGLWESAIAELDGKIGDYVAADASAYFTYEQYQAALPQLLEVGHLRAQSVKGQLEGTIPSTTSGQSADRSSLVDASGVNLSALGSMMGGNRQGGEPEPQDGFTRPEGQGGFDRQGAGGPGGMADAELMGQAMEILMGSGGEITGEVRAALLELGLSQEQIDMLQGMQNGHVGGNMGGNMGANIAPGMPQEENHAALAIGILLALLAGAILFVARPRRNVA